MTGFATAKRTGLRVHVDHDSFIAVARRAVAAERAARDTGSRRANRRPFRVPALAR
ncbi:hypothetical protein BLA50215_03508 [Burkholderia lata]|nr:hypothetical protein BLA50215_03508 [Burkholderia lata]